MEMMGRFILNTRSTRFVLSDWARWVAVDANGTVWEYEEKPFVYNNETEAKWSITKGDLEKINKVVPPLNFKKCIWEIKK